MFAPAAIFSSLLIGGGIVAFFDMGGFNLGVDFRAGMVQEVQIAPTAFTLTWDGEGAATLQADRLGVYVTRSGVGIETRLHAFTFGQYPTVAELTSAMVSELDGLAASLDVPGSTASQWLTRGALGSPELGRAPLRMHVLDPTAAELPVNAVRDALEAGIGQAVVVQSIGQPADRHFLIRVQADGDGAAGIPSDRVAALLESAFGEGSVMVLRSDFVDQRFAGNLTNQIGVLIAATLLLVLAYASIRFKLQYAVGAVLGIMHDGIVVVTFVVVTRMEFNTTTIAAILTILGYSTNNTIVVFDRIRENRRLYPEETFVNIMNRSLSETLNRTVITTVSTMLAVMSLFVFTTGAMRDFALALMIGMVSGVYTTTFIVTGFMNFWEKRRTEKARREIAGRTPKPRLAKPELSKA
jgi:preprotein translocase subunit SecF